MISQMKQHWISCNHLYKNHYEITYSERYPNTQHVLFVYKKKKKKEKSLSFLFFWPSFWEMDRDKILFHHLMLYYFRKAKKKCTRNNAIRFVMCIMLVCNNICFSLAMWKRIWYGVYFCGEDFRLSDKIACWEW